MGEQLTVKLLRFIDEQVLLSLKGKKMRYFALDLETTGLNPDTDQILEIALVDSLTGSEFHRYIKHDRICGDPVALAMNARIIKIIAEYDTHLYTFDFMGSITNSICHWLSNLNASKSISICGKNVGGFDYQFLRNLPGFDRIGGGVSLKNGLYKFRQRILDPAILYIQEGDEELPNLKTCCQRAGIVQAGEHDALIDAKVVMELLSRKGL